MLAIVALLERLFEEVFDVQRSVMSVDRSLSRILERFFLYRKLLSLVSQFDVKRKKGKMI
jgi:hypothetical protein